MTKMQSKAGFVFDQQQNHYSCQGNWRIIDLHDLPTQLKHGGLPSGKKITINGGQLLGFDSAGALTLLQCIAELKKHKNQVELADFHPEHQQLMSLIENKHEAMNYQTPRPKQQRFFYFLGREATNKFHQMEGLVQLIGNISDKLYSALRDRRHLHFASIVSNIYAVGITALPIIAWLSFLIGIVLAYQLGLELETYGANIYIAYLSGLAIFREFGPLITAIIIAGRTSSAFTAQIGSMKINEEIDALQTMGLSPIEYLVLPKVLGLLIILPLLIFWADIFGTLGAMLLSKYMLAVGYTDFLTRLQESVGLKQMMLGLYKAPVFSILIALVGCFQGFRVQANADSVGKQTTKSVVQALFLIIIADAAYSIIYGWLDV